MSETASTNDRTQGPTTPTMHYTSSEPSHRSCRRDHSTHPTRRRAATAWAPLVGALFILVTAGCEREWAALLQTIEDVQELTGTPAEGTTPDADSSGDAQARDDRDEGSATSTKRDARGDQNAERGPSNSGAPSTSNNADAEPSRAHKAGARDDLLTASVGVPCERTGQGSPRLGVAPKTREIGHHAAASFPLGLAPLDEAFILEEIVYYTLDDPSRLPRLGLIEHDVEIFISPRIAPPRKPKVLRKTRVKREMFGERPAFLVPEGPFYEVRVPVTPPLTLQGQGHFFVSVKIDRDEGSGKTLGLGVCTTVPAERSWWSGARKPPFRWKALQSYGIQGAFIAHLKGRRAH